MSAETDKDGFVKLSPKFIKRFYEPLVVYKVLISQNNEAAVANSPNYDLTIDSNNDKEIFQGFVYKLAHVCDSVKGNGGSTITSFMLLKDDDKPDRVHYWFASNRRAQDKLKSTAGYVEGLLQMAGRVSPDRVARKKTLDQLLSTVISFNCDRIVFYLRRMKEHAEECLATFSPETITKEPRLPQRLKSLLQEIDFDLSSKEPSPVLVENTKKAIYFLDSFQSSETGQEMIMKAREGRIMLGVPSKECWSNLWHAVSRTLAYLQSVRFILLARSKWPQLFHSFKISFLASSTKGKTPARQASLAAEKIAGRMSGDKSKIEDIKERARKLQDFKLDTLIQKEYQNKEFRPIVHSEVLLLDYVDRKGGAAASMFFNDWAYIGSSKPTCKLCHYYFQAYAEIHSRRVECRNTHGNIYLYWRIPDILPSQGPEGIRNARKKMERVLDWVRDDTDKVLDDATGTTRKANDSDTFSKRLSTLREDESQADVDDLASDLGQMDMNDGVSLIADLE